MKKLENAMPIRKIHLCLAKTAMLLNSTGQGLQTEYNNLSNRQWDLLASDLVII